MGQSLFITWESEDFLGNHMVSGGNQGEGGQASLPGGGTQRKLTANHMGSLEHYRASWGEGGGKFNCDPPP